MTNCREIWADVFKWQNRVSLGRRRLTSTTSASTTDARRFGRDMPVKVSDAKDVTIPRRRSTPRLVGVPLPQANPVTDSATCREWPVPFPHKVEETFVWRTTPATVFREKKGARGLVLPRKPFPINRTGLLKVFWILSYYRTDCPSIMDHPHNETFTLHRA